MWDTGGLFRTELPELTRTFSNLVVSEVEFGSSDRQIAIASKTVEQLGFHESPEYVRNQLQDTDNLESY